MQGFCSLQWQTATINQSICSVLSRIQASQIYVLYPVVQKTTLLLYNLSRFHADKHKQLGGKWASGIGCSFLFVAGCFSHALQQTGRLRSEPRAFRTCIFILRSRCAALCLRHRLRFLCTDLCLCAASALRHAVPLSFVKLVPLKNNNPFLWIKVCLGRSRLALHMVARVGREPRVI